MLQHILSKTASSEKKIFKVGKINVWWLPEQGKNNTTVTNQVWHKEKHILSAGQVDQKHFLLRHYFCE